MSSMGGGVDQPDWSEMTGGLEKMPLRQNGLEKNEEAQSNENGHAQMSE